MFQRLSLVVLLWFIGLGSTKAQFFVSGAVQDEFGAGIEGLKVQAYRAPTSGTPEELREQTTGSNGSFSFSLSAGNWEMGAFWNYSWARDRGYMAVMYPVAVVENVTTNLVLPRLTSRVEGQIRTASGEPVADQQIDFRQTFNGQLLFQPTFSDENGFFSARLSNGTWTNQPYEGSIFARGFNPIPAQIILLTNETNAGRVFIAQPSTNLIQGRVFDETGAPATNLTVIAMNNGYQVRSALTDTNGFYSIPAFPGWWTVSLEGVSERGYLPPGSPWHVTVEETAVTTQNLRIYRTPFTIRISLVDTNGAPYLGTISASASGEAVGNSFFLPAKYLGNGVMTFSVPSGIWSIGIQPSDSALRRVGGQVTIWNESVDLTFTVRPFVRDSMLSAKIVDEGGRTMTNATLNLSGRQHFVLPPTAIQPDGWFNIDLPAGEYYASATLPGYVSPSVRISVDPEMPRTNVLTMRRLNSEIVIPFEFPEGGGQTVYVFGQIQYLGNTYSTSASAQQSPARLPAFEGMWNISASASSLFGVMNFDMNVVAGTNQAGVVRFVQRPTPMPARIRGRLVSSTGATVADQPVRANGAQGFQSQLTGEDGRFELQVSDGQWDVSLIGTHRLMINRTVTLTNGVDVNIGDIEVPTFNVKGQLTFVDSVTGAPLTGEFANSLIAVRQVGDFSYTVADAGSFNGRTLYLGPGQWSIHPNLTLPGYGFANTLSVQVGTTNFTQTIPVRKLAVSAAPTMTMVKNSAGAFVLRVRSESARYVTLESSVNLETWVFYASQGFAEPVIDFDLNSFATNRVNFFRVIADR